jgi:uncharacterized lipoprotein YmbA
MTTTARVCLLGLIAALPLAEACSFLKPKADPTQYFVLTSDEHDAQAAPAQKVLGVDRIELPEYLLRSELTTRTASNQLKVADYDRWGEPLKDGFSRTLRSDLESRLGAGHVVTAPFDPSHKPALIVDVEVRRFERVLPGGVELEATWSLRDGVNGTVLATKEASVHQPVAGEDTRATVSALSAALAALATQIADAVRERSRPPASARALFP